MSVPTTAKIAIGLPRGADTKYHYEWIRSLFHMFGKSPCNYKMISESKVHHVARNSIIEKFLKTDMEYLLFIDSDIIFEPDSLELVYELIQNSHVETRLYIHRLVDQVPVAITSRFDESTDWSPNGPPAA